MGTEVNDCPTCNLQLKDKDKDVKVDALVTDIITGKISSNFDDVMKELDKILNDD